MNYKTMHMMKTRIYYYLENAHGFKRSTLKMLDYDNLLVLAADYDFNFKY